MPSSVIRHFRYDPIRRALRIRFVTGKVYVYVEVPPATFDELAGAASKGRFFNRHIRGRFPFTEVTGAKAVEWRQ